MIVNLTHISRTYLYAFFYDLMECKIAVYTLAIQNFKKYLIPDVVRLDIYVAITWRVFKSFIIRTLWRIYYYELCTKNT